MDYGCTVTSVSVPDRKGVIADIVTGYENFEDWIKNPAYFGSLIGRSCNRIGKARFKIDGIEYKVSANHGESQLHGGFSGFSHKLWNVAIIQDEDQLGLEFTYLSQDGEEGFPGNLKVKVNYLLTNGNEFSMEFEAVTDKTTVVNLTNHAYFNLGGVDSGVIYGQELQIHADTITETDSDLIPTGKFRDIRNTPYDFSTQKAIGSHINEIQMGYDDNYVLRDWNGDLRLAASAWDPFSGRTLDIYTTEPGIQLYTSNWFDGSILGRDGIRYQKHEAFALETQHFPDSMNQPEFPSVLLNPGSKYSSKTMWKFSTR